MKGKIEQQAEKERKRLAASAQRADAAQWVLAMSLAQSQQEVTLIWEGDESFTILGKTIDAAQVIRFSVGNMTQV